MSTFLLRVARWSTATAVVVAATAIFGTGPGDYVPTASKHEKPAAGTANCTLSGTTVGGQLTLTGTGYAPDTDYAAEIQWPNGGAGTLPANSDSTGAIHVSTYAWWSGTYQASVFTTTNHTQLMASCATTVP